jgi:hypothetical protein
MNTKLFLMAISAMLLFSCGSAPAIKYEITREDNRDPIINLDIYLKDTADIYALHELILKKYNPNKDKAMIIMYFDDKHVAQIWQQKLKDDAQDKVTQKEWNNLQIHRIGLYSSNPATGFERFEREYKDSW